VKQFAIGLAAGIIIDATLIRALLVPSLMRLFGRWSPWFPNRSASSWSCASPSRRRRRSDDSTLQTRGHAALGLRPQVGLLEDRQIELG
jgi:uncharacterized membrane protein YdfJ with MMPL/SSD domain